MTATNAGISMSPPLSLEDVIADGLLLTVAQDQALATVIAGKLKAFSINCHAGSTRVDVRLHGSRGTVDVAGQTVAYLDEHRSTWTWATEATVGLDIPQLHGQQDYDPTLVVAARTLFAGNPVLLAPLATTTRRAGAPAYAAEIAVALELPPAVMKAEEAIHQVLSTRPQQPVHAAAMRRAVAAWYVARNEQPSRWA